MDVDLAVPFALVALLVFIYSQIDLHYYLRIVFHYFYFQEQLTIDGTSTFGAICTTGDVDLFCKNMSNSRYLREADFGRFDFIRRSGLYQIITEAKGHIAQGACNIRFRRPIPLFSRFTITTKVIYWDEKSIFFEQQFISTKDNFVRAVLISQNRLINLDAAATINKLLDKDLDYRPELPEEVKLWVDSMQVSSQKLRKQD